jgi:cytochrome c-type biogenesis protein CcmH/NrfG
MQYPVPGVILGPPIPLMAFFPQLALAILLLACPSLAYSQGGDNQTEPISSALRAGDFDKAVELSRAALKESPNNAQLWTLQGIAFTRKGDDKAAVAAFQQALKISPNNLAALPGAAQIEYQVGSQSALPLLRRLVQLRP